MNLSKFLFFTVQIVFLMGVLVNCSTQGEGPLSIGTGANTSPTPSFPIFTGGLPSPTPSGSSGGSCTIALNPSQSNYSLNTSASVALSYNGTTAPATVCVNILAYNSGSQQYVLASQVCGGYPYTGSVNFSATGQFQASVTMVDSNNANLCTSGVTPATYTVGSGTTGQVGFSVNGVQQSVLTGNLDQYFALYLTAPSTPDGVDLLCGGQDFGGTVSYSQAVPNAPGYYQTNFYVYGSFPDSIVGLQNGCTVTAKIGSTASNALPFTLLPQIKEIVYSDYQAQSATSDRSHIIAWGNFGTSVLAYYSCDGGTSTNYNDGQAWVLAKTNATIEMKIDSNDIGKLCHFYIEESTSGGVAPNPTSFDFTP